MTPLQNVQRTPRPAAAYLGLQIPKNCPRKATTWTRAACPPPKVSWVVAQGAMVHMLPEKPPTLCKMGLAAQMLRVPPEMPHEPGKAGSQGVTRVVCVEFTRPMWSQIWLCAGWLNTENMVPAIGYMWGRLYTGIMAAVPLVLAL